jgi:hypothetical protein
MDERPVDRGAPVTEAPTTEHATPAQNGTSIGETPEATPTIPLRSASCEEELSMLSDQSAAALAAVCESLVASTGLIRPQALGVVVAALFRVTEAVGTVILTVPDDAPDRVAALALVAESRQGLLYNVQVLYQAISEAGERARILTPKFTRH